MKPVRCRVERLAPCHARTLFCKEEVSPDDLENRFAALAAVRARLEQAGIKGGDL